MKVISTSVSKSDGTVWANVDPKSLNDDAQLAYEAYKESYETTRRLRVEFEEQFRADAGDRGIKFSYNFGKLSVAMGDPPQGKAQPEAKMSLADFMASQGRLGRSI